MPAALAGEPRLTSFLSALFLRCPGSPLLLVVVLGHSATESAHSIACSTHFSVCLVQGSAMATALHMSTCTAERRGRLVGGGIHVLHITSSLLRAPKMSASAATAVAAGAQRTMPFGLCRGAPDDQTRRTRLLMLFHGLSGCQVKPVHIGKTMPGKTAVGFIMFGGVSFQDSAIDGHVTNHK